MKRIGPALLAVVLLFPFGGYAGSSGSRSSSSRSVSRSRTLKAPKAPKAAKVKAVRPPKAPKARPAVTRCATCARDNDGRIKRSRTATRDFQRTHPCPSTGKASGACPGYVIDHVVPLKRGGADAPSNVQWQTPTAAKAKDKIE